MTATRLLAFSCAVTMTACGSDSAGGDTDTDAQASSSESGASAASEDTGDTADTAADSGSTSAQPTSDTNATSGDPTDPDSSGTDDPSDTAETGVDPGDPVIPELQGDCPQFNGGGAENPEYLTFPVGNGSRQALVYYDAGSGGGGPLVFYFHGGGGDPEDAVPSVSAIAIGEILAMGGMVVSPLSDPAAGFEWFLSSSGQAENDLVMMDSIVACADAGPGIDVNQIHGIGFSAGALHIAQASTRRSSYMASVISYSGGLGGGVGHDNPDATPSALIFHGGDADNVQGLPFQATSENFAEFLRERGGYAVVCDHGAGHTYPPNEQGVWRRADAYLFFLDHPFGVDPSPYEGGFPEWMPPYCAD